MGKELSVMSTIYTMLTNPGHIEYKADKVYDFIEENKEYINMKLIYRLIFILMKNNFPMEELKDLASMYKDTFVVDYNEIFCDTGFSKKDDSKESIYIGNILYCLGIPKENFLNFDTEQFSGTEYVPKNHSNIIECIKDGDLANFTLEYQRSSVRPWNLIWWAVVYTAPDIFKFLATKMNYISEKVIIFALSKRNVPIIDTIFSRQTKSQRNMYIKYLIKFHANKALRKYLPDDITNTHNLLMVAEESLNYEACLMLLPKLNELQ